MNKDKKDKLEQINRIEQEIKEIDSFLSNYYKAPRYFKLAAFKQNFVFSLKLGGYGTLSRTEYELPRDLNNEILNVVFNYREKLIAEQDKLWGDNGQRTDD